MMSLLEKFWDDTVAGPRPERGLGKLRKYSSLNSRSNSGKESSSELNGHQRSYVDETTATTGGDDVLKVTRSIMIVRPPQVDQKDSPPVSPAGSTPPLSPFSGVGGKEAYRFRRRSASFAYDKVNGTRDRRPPPSYYL